MGEMGELIQHIREAEDPFKHVSHEDLQARVAAAKVEKQKRIAAWEKKHGRKAESCPYCGANFMDGDSGVYTNDIVEETSEWGYDEKRQEWDWLESERNDREEGDSFCGECDKKLTRGVDWDVEN